MSEEVSIYGDEPTYIVEAAPKDKTKRFVQLAEHMAATYSRKNADYGDSFGVSVRKYGPIAGLTRISDKFNRLESLILKNEQHVADESVTDTLLDLANYSIMLLMELEDK
ncbi:nucleotide modification associated domain-containing protein [Xylanibacter rodentium]|uniref:nucleotide modification associated domain-containing protein n=1 Tax=Xylanibacter rodentium TaxID=2736289 RepID=UPI0025770B47|nr:nucleotide modification associated domain-containing protein [Xylanibacter rodentium]